jgi:hypothetical protein
MALYYDLPVYKDVYSLILILYRYTKEFSREYKYTIGQDLKRDALVSVRGVYRVNKASDKAEHFVQLLDDFELIKFQIRLCGDLKLFTIKQQSELIELCDTIGKQKRTYPKGSLSALKKRNDSRQTSLFIYSSMLVSPLPPYWLLPPTT